MVEAIEEVIEEEDHERRTHLRRQYMTVFLTHNLYFLLMKLVQSQWVNQCSKHYMLEQYQYKADL
jgi:hypothetical protein